MVEIPHCAEPIRRRLVILECIYMAMVVEMSPYDKANQELIDRSEIRICGHHGQHDPFWRR